MTVLDRSMPPVGGDVRDFSFPAVDRRTLATGLDLRVARVARFPVVSAVLFVRAGEAALPDARAGLAVLAGNALEGGTRRRSGVALADALERIGARLHVATGWEGTSVSVSCLAERLETALALLAETVLQPDFPETEVDRARAQQLAEIRQRLMDPGPLASDQAARMYFAPGVPYARRQQGTTESVAALGRVELRSFAEAWYRPGRGGLILAGDVDADEMEALAGACFGGWTGEPPAGDGFEVDARTRERRIRVVDRPGSVQSEIRVGHIGVSRSDPDVFPLTVLNTLLGGAFTSRLNLNLRERHGFTYGARSHFVMRRRGGSFEVHTAVGTDVTAPAVREIAAELEGLAASGPTPEEVEAARDYIAGVFPLRAESVGQVANLVAEQVVYGLEDDYHATYRGRIRGVTPEAVWEAARRHVRPHSSQIVIVGDAASVAPALEALALGPVEVVTAGED
jgi:zinc protease